MFPRELLYCTFNGLCETGYKLEVFQQNLVLISSLSEPLIHLGHLNKSVTSILNSFEE